MTREELLKLGKYAPTRFSEQIELRLKLGQKVLFKFPRYDKYIPVLISIRYSNAPYINPDCAKIFQYQLNVRDFSMINKILSMSGWGMVSEYLIRLEDIDEFIYYLHD